MKNKEPFDYKFNPTAGMPLPSMKEGTYDEKRVTWFSTIGEEQAEKAAIYYKERDIMNDQILNSTEEVVTVTEAPNKDIVLEVLDTGTDRNGGPSEAKADEAFTDGEPEVRFVQFDEVFEGDEVID